MNRKVGRAVPSAPRIWRGKPWLQGGALGTARPTCFIPFNGTKHSPITRKKTGLRWSHDPAMMPHMNVKSLTVVALMKAKPGKEAEVRQELLSLVAPSRKDAGCLNYDLHQALDNPTHFMFHENWTSKAQLDRHLQKPDLQAVLSRVGKMVAEPPQITLWERISD